MISYFSKLINYLCNLNLILSNNDIYSLSCVSIIKNLNLEKNTHYYIINTPINSFNFIQYFYIIYAIFFKINIIFIDFIPNNIDFFIFLSRIINIDINIIDNNDKISNSNYNIYINNDLIELDKLYVDQKIFFNKIKEKEDIKFMKALNLYFNIYKFNEYDLWNLSLDCDIAINFLIREGEFL